MLFPKKKTFFLVLAGRIVPAIGSLPPEEQDEIAAVVHEALAQRDKAVQMQFRLLLEVLRWSTMPRHGRPLDKLPGAVQDEVIRRMEDSPFPRIRTGVWGLKTLVYMGYYGDPERAQQFGYAPSFEGNGRL